MPYITNSLRTLYFLTLFGLLQHISGQTLQGCAAVNCPNRYENTLSPTCQVQTTDMSLIGLLSTTSTLLNTNLTWTIGDSGLQSTITGNQRTVTRSFYLGTPESVDLRSAVEVKGCAIFVIDRERGAYQVYDQGAPQYVNSASCAASMGQTCVDDLTSQVEELARSESNRNTDSFCKNIANALRHSPPSSCYILTQQPRIQSIPLTGPSAPEPITETQNSTSNCWPTLPKTNGLTKVFEYDHIANLTEWVAWLGYTPLITVFASGNGMGDVEVGVKCMKVVDSDGFSEGMVGEGGEVGGLEGGAVQRNGGGWGVFALFVGTWVTVLL
jgi:hypothetical protein